MTLHRLTRNVLILNAMAGCAFAVHAQKPAPGLWENVVTMKSGNARQDDAMAQAQAALASMPPEQRKMMQDMMAKQGVAMGSKPNSMQICITPEMAERGELPHNEGRCTQKTLSRSASTVKYSFRCDTTPPTSGEGEYTLSGDKSYSGRNVVTTTVQGKPERMEMTVNGKWLGADCGALKPKR